MSWLSGCRKLRRWCIRDFPGICIRFGGLCGAGVAFKLAWAICQRASNAQKVSPQMRDFLVAAMGYAALGTVADVVPLIDENRILVHHGLSSLHQHPQTGHGSVAGRDPVEPEAASDERGFGLHAGSAAECGRPAGASAAGCGAADY